MSIVAAHRQANLLPTQNDPFSSTRLMAPRAIRPSPSRDLTSQPTASSSTSQAGPSATSSPIRRPPSRTEKKFKCTFEGCDKAYYKPSRLAEHELTHTGERPHTCAHCSQSYLRASHLTAHLRTHLDNADRPFVCEVDGCGKRFWTATHLRRHGEVHEAIPAHKCPHCDAAFTKAHHLRDHVVLAHMPAGTKPYICEHPGCGASFALRGQLKSHEKTHDETRYTCSHPSHNPFPSFSTWSALQSHMREAHAPTCPHRECHGRTFKSAQRLRDHLKVHEEREVDLGAVVLDADREGRGEGDELLDGLGGGRRKRRRKSEVVRRMGEGDEEDEGDEGQSDEEEMRRRGAKLRRLSEGKAGKDFACDHEGCRKAFKTKYALASHISASHLGSKFPCPRPGCEKAFAHRSNLKRHLAAHDAAGTDADAGKDATGTMTDVTLGKEKKKKGLEGAGEGFMDAITGTGRYTRGRFVCPIKHVREMARGNASQNAHESGGTGEAQRVLAAEDAGRERGQSQREKDDDDTEHELECHERYSRVYDVRRHLASAHGVEGLTDGDVRVLLARDRSGDGVGAARREGKRREGERRSEDEAGGE